MEIKEVLEKIQKSEQFQNFQSDHKEAYFSYALKTSSPEKEDPWQCGFFNSANQKVTTFILNQDTVEMQQEDEVFKKPEMDVKPIELDKVTQSFEEIMQKAADFQKQQYPKELINRKISILQSLEEQGTIWNLTLISQTFNTINIKMKADSGEVLSHSCENFMNFIKQ